MLCLLRFFAVCVCFHQVLARPRGPRGTDHNMEKRWAYIENGDPQMRTIHTDCKKIVREYSNGELPFYEYTAKMKKCMTRQERNSIPSFDGEYFTPSFTVPRTAEKRFETPRYEQQPQMVNSQYGNYGYDYNNQYQQNTYGPVDQRANIASPQTPQYAVPAQSQPQAQAFPATNYNYNDNYYQENQQQQLAARNEIAPSYQEPNEQETMYSSDIVKKDKIPKPEQEQ